MRHLFTLTIVILGLTLVLACSSDGDDPPKEPTLAAAEEGAGQPDDPVEADPSTQGEDSPDSEPRRYVADICEPFARYFERAIELGFPDFEGVATFEELLPIMRQMRANAQASHDSFAAVTPPQAMRDTPEEAIAELEIEIRGYQRLEDALESGDSGLIDQALREADSIGSFGSTGFIPTNVPRGYEEAWEEDCVPRLEQIPGVG